MVRQSSDAHGVIQTGSSPKLGVRGVGAGDSLCGAMPAALIMTQYYLCAHVDHFFWSLVVELRENTK